jgi:putative peptidoglycan lipid II flippase
VFRSIFTNSFGILISRILGFIRDLLTASILGANIYSDIFFVAFKFPNLLRRIFGEGAFTQSFLPSFTAAKIKSVFAMRTFVIFFAIILFLTIFVNLFSQETTKLFAYGFSPEIVEKAAPFVAINFTYLLLIFSVTFLSALLHYKEHFATTAFATALLNIAMISALLLAQGSDQETIVYYLSYGVVVGGVLQLLTHLIAVYKLNLFFILTSGLKYFRVKAHRVQHDTNRFFKKFVPAVWGNSTAQISAFLDTFLASFLITGSISYLYYANRVFQLPLALFAIATSIALFPKVAKLLNRNKTEEALATMQKAFWFLLFLLTYSTFGGLYLAEPIVQLLFERGNFTHDNTIAVAGVLQMYMIGLLPYGLAKLFSLWLYATHQLKVSALISTYTLTLNIVLALALIQPLGALGLALASSLSGILLLILTLYHFSYQRFFTMVKSKYAIYFLVSLLPFYGILLALEWGLLQLL